MSMNSRKHSARHAAVELSAGTVDPEDYKSLRLELATDLRRRFFSITASEIDDIVDAAIEKYLVAIDKGAELRPETALAYLRRIARNEAIDRLRKSRHHHPMVVGERDTTESDDSIARVVDARADAQLIEALLEQAARSGDRLTTRVMNAFLNLAEAMNGPPSSRLVARRAGVSHTTVLSVLAALRSSIDRAQESDLPR